MNADIGFIPADWPAPATIRAGTTLRTGGVSQAPFDSLNLGGSSGDSPRAVARNRARLRQSLALPGEPAWLAQVHGTHVADAAGPAAVEADASVAESAEAVCVVLTADCLPVLFCDRAGSCWAAAHGGWRGLAAGVLEAAIARLPVPAGDLLAWLGPAIGPAAFEIGQDVRDAFCSQHPQDAAAFTPAARAGKYLADIYLLARLRLGRAGVTAVYGGHRCTYSEPDKLYSYRRDGDTGRMASLVWRVTGGAKPVN